MWAQARWIVGIGLISLFGAAQAAQAAVPWTLTLQQAKQAAAQSNRLVLIHFWAPWCTACLRMERDVFAQPGVAQAIGTAYVPVKINTEQFPQLVQQFGVRSLPTDLIITPEGQYVHHFEGTVAATAFAAKLHQVAATFRTQQRGQYASIAGHRPPQPAPSTPNQPRQTTPPAAAQAAGYGAASPDRTAPDRYAAYGGQPQPSVAPALPSYAAREATPSNPGYAPAASGYPPMQQPSIRQAPGQPSPGAMGHGDPAAASQPRVSTEPGGNPPLALDGYCAVQLWDDMAENAPKWTLGDRRWGAIHRGRTYLFAGPEHQQRFLAEPDRFAPVLSGNDPVVAVDEHGEVGGRREHGVFYNDRIWLFSSEDSLETFRGNPDYYAEQALHAMGLQP